MDRSCVIDGAVWAVSFSDDAGELIHGGLSELAVGFGCGCGTVEDEFCGGGDFFIVLVVVDWEEAAAGRVVPGCHEISGADAGVGAEAAEGCAVRDGGRKD